MKYFIVDDNAAMRKLIRASVISECDEVIEFDDGCDVVSSYSQHLPDWVLMDIQMIKMNGIETTKNLKEKFPDAKIIIVTQHDDKFFRLSAQRVHAEGYVLKDNLCQISEIIRYKV